MRSEVTAEVDAVTDKPYLTEVVRIYTGLKATSFQSERNIPGLTSLIDNLQSTIAYLQSCVDYVSNNEPDTRD